MTKKDRIAVVVTVIYSLLPVAGVLNGEEEGLFMIFPVFVYWGYRFIQDDISFIGKKDGKSQ